MSGIYYADILDVLRAAGCKVAESSTTDGWQTRARSSGGFASAPLAVVWHHTASTASPANDLGYMINGSPDAPIGNLLLDRTGTYWPIAAGCANTQGKGGPVTMSRGTIPVDSGNSKAWAIEACNSGVGEIWPVAQIDAYFLGSNALSAHFGNLPTDVITHHHWAPDRKIDPAIAWEVEGPWQPGSSTTSGTWTLSDIHDECVRRAGAVTSEPIPPTPPQEDDDMLSYIFRLANGDVGIRTPVGVRRVSGGELGAGPLTGQPIWDVPAGSADEARIVAEMHAYDLANP